MVTAAGVWGAILALIVWRLRGLAADDFFITYRYAQNLAAGAGFVFNPGERVFGLTDPGLGLLLAALHAATGASIPALGTASTAAALAGIALLLLGEACERGRRAEGLAGGSLVVTSSYLWVNQGGGVFWSLLLLLAAARLGRRRPVLAGVLAGAAVWMRPDALAGAGLLGLLLWSEERPPPELQGRPGRLPWRYGLAAALVVGAGAALAWFTFDAVVPNTLAAKHAMGVGVAGSWSGPQRFWARAVPLLGRHWGGAWWAVVVVGTIGQWPLFRAMGRAGRLLVLFAAFLDLAYPCLDLPFFSWYTVPFAVVTLNGIAFALVGIGRAAVAAVGIGRLRRHAAAGTGRAAAGIGRAAAGIGRAAALGGSCALLGALLLAPLLAADWRWFRVFDWQPHLDTYRRAAEWLARSSAPQDRVAYVEIGVLSYYSRRPIVDLLGLVTPGSIPYVEHDDLVGAFLARPARFVIYHTRGRMAPLLAEPWFSRAYEQVARFEQGGGGRQWLAIYRRVPGVPLPPERPPRASAARAGSGHG